MNGVENLDKKILFFVRIEKRMICMTEALNEMA